jgi:hypothetical protein
MKLQLVRLFWAVDRNTRWYTDPAEHELIPTGLYETRQRVTALT